MHGSNILLHNMRFLSTIYVSKLTVFTSILDNTDILTILYVFCNLSAISHEKKVNLVIERCFAALCEYQLYRCAFGVSAKHAGMSKILRNTSTIQPGPERMRRVSEKEAGVCQTVNFVHRREESKNAVSILQKRSNGTVSDISVLIHNEISTFLTTLPFITSQ